MTILNGFIATLVTILGGLLGAMGGAENSSKALRRIILPAIITVIAYFQTASLYVLSIMTMTFARLGYGLPSPDDDKPSILGKFFFDIFNGNMFLANVFTRGTIGVITCFTLLSVPIIKHNWGTYTLSCALIIFAYSCLSWRDLGVFQFFKWQLLWSEALLYGTITLASLILILK